MAKQSEPVVFHDMGHASSRHPILNLLPGDRIVIQHSRHLKRKEYAHVRRRSRSPAPGRPGTMPATLRHLPPIGESIESRVVDGSARREAEHDNGTFARRTTGSTVEERAYVVT